MVYGLKVCRQSLCPP